MLLLRDLFKDNNNRTAWFIPFICFGNKQPTSCTDKNDLCFFMLKCFILRLRSLLIIFLCMCGCVFMFMRVHTCVLVHGDVILMSGIYLYAHYHGVRASQLNSRYPYLSILGSHLPSEHYDDRWPGLRPSQNSIHTASLDLNSGPHTCHLHHKCCNCSVIIQADPV